MSTTAFAPIGGNTAGIMPQPKSTRDIVREELKRRDELKVLEEKHNSGEISDFEYRVSKILLNLPQPDIARTMDTPCFSTTA